jgi:tetrahydromethanopterin S-methyltransferase subunit G
MLKSKLENATNDAIDILNKGVNTTVGEVSNQITSTAKGIKYGVYTLVGFGVLLCVLVIAIIVKLSL